MSSSDQVSDRPPPHRWKPLEDVPPDVTALAQAAAESAAIRRAWSTRKLALEASGELSNFNQRLVRQWCIETGVIEGIYRIEDGLTVTLIERGFDAAFVSDRDVNIPASRLIDILRDHERAAAGLLTFVNGDRPLSTSYIEELHQTLTAHQDTCDGVDQFGSPVCVPLLKGAWKLLPNNPSDSDSGTVVHEYCPPEHVAMEMDRLIDMHAQHDSLDAEVSAAWLHHRFTQIHPFQDGNGRVARAIATLVLLKQRGFPLVVLRDNKAEYINALRQADDGHLLPLVAMFSRLQKAASLQAMEVANQSISTERNIDGILLDAGAKLRAAAAGLQANLHATMDALCGEAFDRCEAVAENVRTTLSGIPDASVSVFRSGIGSEHHFAGQIIATSRKLRYYANVSGKRDWVHLRIRHGRTTGIVVSFHHIDRADSNLVAANAFVVTREQAEDDHESPPHSQPCCTAPFTFTADRSLQDLTLPFHEWLDAALTTGLGIWHRSL